MECPFPHLSATVHPVSLEKWVQQTGQQPTANAAYMHKHIEQLHKEQEAHAGQQSSVRELPWLEQEELFVRQGLLVVAVVVAISMALTLVRSLISARSALA